MIIIENLFYILLISWIVVEHPIFSVITDIINDLINKKKNKLITFILTKPTSCFKCSSLYVGIIWCLIFSQPWWLPIAASFLMKLYDQKLNSIEL